MAGSVSYKDATIDGNALYRDSNSNTYVVIEPLTANVVSCINLGSFNFSDIPSNAIVASCVVRIKAASGGSYWSGYSFTVSINQSTATQAKKTLGPTASIYEVDITSNWSKIDPSEFYVQIPTWPTPGSATNYVWFYGMDIQVEYDLPVNKVVYGTTVLVDLTEDTVTPNDLSEGVTAHDKSGGLITGTNQRGIMVIRDSDDSHGGTVRTITSGEAQIGGMTEADLKNFIGRSTSFTSIDWPDGLGSIGNHAFAFCTKFNTSSLPSSVTYIGDYAFWNCISLTLTSLPSSVRHIGEYAFYNCYNLAITSLPDNVTTILAYSFSSCYRIALTSLPSGVTSIGSYAFRYCKSMTLTSLPAGVTVIDSYAFNCCMGITSISCEGHITTFGSYVFTGTSSYPSALVSASFPNMALASNINTAFGSTTVANACQQLAFCDIGSTIGISSNAFANCYALQTLVLRKTESVCNLVTVSAFLNTPMRGYNSLTGTVYVPQALIESYKTATNWSTLYNDGTVTFVAIEGSQYERE